MVCSVCCFYVLLKKKRYVASNWTSVTNMVSECVLHMSVNLIGNVGCMKLGFHHETKTLYVEKYFAPCV
jgi:hypothetical protein